ncbi:hypothetical protein ACFSND_04015 [Brevibacillus brevis]|uniref:hypothetical protein n=1 Tax=Brevibacillus brevis TaxID=1393 RepID=UPI00362DC373
MDKTRTTIQSISGTNVTVASVVRLCSWTRGYPSVCLNQEERTITAINASTRVITLNAAPTSTYTENAILARSTVEIDTAAKRMRRGSIDTYSVKIAVT